MTDQKDFDKTATIMPGSMDLSRGDSGSDGGTGTPGCGLPQDAQCRHRRAPNQTRRPSRKRISSFPMTYQSGHMSQLAAAQALAALHAKAFADAQERIDQALAQRAEHARWVRQGHHHQGLQGGGKRPARLLRYRCTAASDQQAVASQQLGPATRDALSKMVQDWSNMTQSLVQIMGRSIDSLNDDLAKMVTGHGSRKDFGKTLTETGQGLVKTGLQGMEGQLLKGFGFGGAKNKPTGAKGDPIHTVNDGQGGAGLGANLPAFVQPFFGGGQSSTGANPARKSGGFTGLLGSILGTALRGLLQGSFAGGGNFVANRPMLVGEHGAEIITPGPRGQRYPQSHVGGRRWRHACLQHRRSRLQ